MISDQEHSELEPPQERSSFPDGASGQTRYEEKKKKRREKKKDIRHCVMKWWHTASHTLVLGVRRSRR